MSKLGKDLVQSANEAVAIAKGEADPATYTVHVSADIDVRAIRLAFNMTQQEFCNRFGFGLPALRDWEQGRRQPDRSARILLKVIEREPNAVDRALDDARVPTMV